MLARDKHTSLLQQIVNYSRKKFYRIGPKSTKLFRFGVLSGTMSFGQKHLFEWHFVDIQIIKRDLETERLFIKWHLNSCVDKTLMLAECLLTKCLFAKCRPVKCLLANVCWQMSVGKCLFSKCLLANAWLVNVCLPNVCLANVCWLNVCQLNVCQNACLLAMCQSA